jgi:hypothetical protein
MSFPKVLRGKAWKFGANIDTDQIIPAKYAIYSLPPLRRPPLRSEWSCLGSSGAVARPSRATRMEAS